MRRHFYLSHVAALALILAPASLLAQTPSSQLKTAQTNLVRNANLQPLITARQLEQIKAITSRDDEKILTSFKGREALKSTLQSELKVIDNEADPVKKSALIKAYQLKHAAAYKQVMATARVDMAVMARDLSAAVPDMEFRVIDGIGLKGVMKKTSSPPATSSGTSTLKSTSASAPALVPAKTVKALGGSDYTITKDLGCGAVSGSDISVSGGYMTNKAFAAVLGGCTNDGRYKYEFAMPSSQKGKVEMTFDLEAKVFAVGVLGSAGSSASSSIYVSGDDHHELGFDSDDSYISCSVFAPILWAASETCELENGRITATLTQADTYNISASTHTFTIAAAIVAATTAEARIKKLRTTITLEPK
jgi:hypothetical protein